MTPRETLVDQLAKALYERNAEPGRHAHYHELGYLAKQYWRQVVEDALLPTVVAVVADWLESHAAGLGAYCDDFAADQWRKEMEPE